MLKRKQPNSGGTPPWILTYGDMVTLVLTFFVAIYAMSTIDKTKYEEMSSSFRNVFSGPGGGGMMSGAQAVVDPGIKKIIAQPMMTAEQNRTWKQMYQSIDSIVSKERYRGKAEVIYTERGIVISFKEKLFFDLGSADIIRDALPTIREVGITIMQQQFPIRVEGHTCDLPIKTGLYPSNWELSASRAVNVARFLIEGVGFNPERVAVAGYGQYRPIAPNVNEENRARNRRVDIVIINSFLDRSFSPLYQGGIGNGGKN